MKLKHYRVRTTPEDYFEVKAPTRRAAVVTVALMRRAAGGRDMVQGIIEECVKWAVEEVKQENGK